MGGGHSGAEGAAAESEEEPTKVPEPTECLFKRGDLIELGRHRLYCGDSTDLADVEKLMNGRQAAAVFTDPPYAIYGSSTGIAEDITDDKMVRPFFRDVIRDCTQVLEVFGHAYICCDWRSWASWWEVAKGTGITCKNMIVWDKGSGLGGMYANCHELIFFASLRPMREHMKQKISGERNCYGLNVWRINRACNAETEGKRAHNAQKPIELVTTALEQSTEEGALVVDFFLGSGTTLVACEKIGRTCYGLEIDPRYVQVIVERFKRYQEKNGKQFDCKVNGEPFELRHV